MTISVDLSGAYTFKEIFSSVIQKMPSKYLFNDGIRDKLYFLLPPNLWSSYRSHAHSKQKESEAWHLSNREKLSSGQFNEEDRLTLELNILLYENSETHRRLGERGSRLGEQGIADNLRAFGADAYTLDIPEDTIILRSEGLHPNKEIYLRIEDQNYPFAEISNSDIWQSPRTVSGYNIP